MFFWRRCISGIFLDNLKPPKGTKSDPSVSCYDGLYHKSYSTFEQGYTLFLAVQFLVKTLTFKDKEWTGQRNTFHLWHSHGILIQITKMVWYEISYLRTWNYAAVANQPEVWWLHLTGVWVVASIMARYDMLQWCGGAITLIHCLHRLR